mmetsp:Transcript_41320/g.99270  ORF Transcript_41320/g.99270 Transcript_41320/m.99270 type:complete len:205 (-) Transcript_41320:462-1076(-)
MLLAMMKRRQPVGSRASMRRRVPMRLCSCPFAILQPLGAPARCTQQSMRILTRASSSPGASRSLSTVSMPLTSHGCLDKLTTRMPPSATSACANSLPIQPEVPVMSSVGRPSPAPPAAAASGCLLPKKPPKKPPGGLALGEAPSSLAGAAPSTPSAAASSALPAALPPPSCFGSSSFFNSNSFFRSGRGGRSGTSFGALALVAL